MEHRDTHRRAGFTPERIAKLTDPRKVEIVPQWEWKSPQPRGEAIPPFVYILRHSTLGDIKFGFTRSIPGRLHDINRVHSRPIELVVVLRGGLDLEAALYLRFLSCRLRGEWFEHRDELAEWLALLRKRHHY